MQELQTGVPGSQSVCEHLFRRQAGRIVASLAGLLGSHHLQLAEDAVQHAMLRALEVWSFQGVPPEPEAWLFRVAHNFAISGLRRMRTFESKTADIIAQVEARSQVANEADIERYLRDEELRMVFLCCHPDVSAEGRIALSLKLVCGFSVGEVARLFLVSDATIAQRLVRAKRVIRERHTNFLTPSPAQLQARLDSVLEVLYLMFSGGYAAHSGQDLIRMDVCSEAIRLGQLLAESSISVPRVDALVALMALQGSRSPARSGASGDLILLEDQDRSLWDRRLLAIGFHYFDRSIAGREVSRWHAEAAIAATYARGGDRPIDWPAMLEHYDYLVQFTDSPVVALNRAVVVAKVHGPHAGLALVDPLQQEPAMRRYYLLPAVRGRFLLEIGNFTEAAAAFSAALDCECSDPEKRFLRMQLTTALLRGELLA